MKTIETINGKEYLAIDHSDHLAKCDVCCVRNIGNPTCLGAKCNPDERSDGRNVYFIETKDEESERIRRMREGLERAEKIMKAKKAEPLEPVRTKDGMIEIEIKGARIVLSLLQARMLGMNLMKVTYVKGKRGNR